MTETLDGFGAMLCQCHRLLSCPNQWMGDRRVVVTAKCSNCTKEDTVAIRMDDYERYTEGAMVQDVWPHFVAQDREIIIGSRAGHYLCSDCWHEIVTEREGGE